ncbi:helix-turn-helix domain-containing protein [Pseudomonas petrae]|uniref:helix-turn-helix domain-containing protein n=1 Tax=Pseudomonas petrae TaxID=2912190 RepID=UPI001F166800|nr:helix-turn-helix domain-containing protein [Pseudomonas petrae]
MTTTAHHKALPYYTPLPDVRSTLFNRRTATIDDFVIDKATGELLGSYNHSEYKPDATEYMLHTQRKKATFSTEEDGSPIFLPKLIDAERKTSAEIFLFPKSQVTPESDNSDKSNAGRPPAMAVNPISALLQYFWLEGHSTAWMDDYICGAAGIEVECEASTTATTGRFNVARSDVRRVLHLPEISTKAAAPILCNHNLQPMSIRQVGRVVKATWIALGGLMLYLERHQELLNQFEYAVDFNEFWLNREKQNRGESPGKTEVMTLLAEGKKIATIAKRTGVHRNTVSRWKRERSNSVMHN